ncbi:hypothetical protein SO802_003623 [Lithocarpus litseifolius]|uniref:Uncharacterized protein n=1 Tax=Lithocarpus litseifolius TaxID=425828 RepID=A0AAW2E4G3_9ROSI
MTTATEVLKFRLPKPETDVGMAFLDHQDSKKEADNQKVSYSNPKAKTETTPVPLQNKTDDHHHQDSKPISKTFGYRERVRKQLQEAFSRVSSETDVSISPAIDPSNPIKKTNYQSILFNLKDPKNADLRRKVLLGEIKPESLVTMSAEEKASQKRQRENIQIQLKSLKRCMHDADEEEKATTDMFQCSRCRERKCTYYQMQTRSADEPMTTYVTCCKCNKRWKV